ncbi:hypothetical protein [Burkholderia sp. F1]|uniref:hypothetical protein n=1 Tax=Burkholderia sp. F1 TaxID=3366817 RepID=UPI003D7636DF
MSEIESGAAPADASIQVKVKLQESPKGEKPPKTVAYAFTGTGHLITQTTVDENGTATLTIPTGQSPREIRVVVGPEVKERQATVSDLTRRGAQEQFLKVSVKSKGLQAVFEIPSQIWLCWIRFCFVQGTLLKRLFSAGLPVDYPVCGAEIQIWEVEPIFLILSKISDVDLEKVRQFLLNPQPLPPGPNPPTPGPVALARLGQLAVARPVGTTEHFTPSSPELLSLRAVAQTGDIVSLRQALTTVDESIIRFIICLLFPPLVFTRLIATATTDRCGRFQTFVILSCYESVNLYFTATVNFFGFPIYIYDPTPVSCFTYWNYQCGTEVELYTDSILAPLCTPCPPVDAPENYVLFRAIGNVQLNGIYGTSTLLSGVTNSTNIGLAANLYGAGLDSPFGNPSGDAIYPRVEFDSSLRALNKATYYQISYRHGLSGSFTPLTGAVSRKFNHFVGTTLVTSVYNLGPQVVNGVPNLFEIPPELPLEGDWAFPNPPVDLANAVFDTSGLSTPGQYQLKLDLFDSTGNPVDVAAAGIGYFVPTTVDPDGTIHTADAATLGLVSANSFIMTLHVDNRPTSGSLANPQLDGHGADDCGVLRYTRGTGEPSGTVTIQYTAAQPDNFATFSYRLSRGVTPLTPPTTSGRQVNAATDPATVTMSVLSLLTEPDGTVCDVAGFAEDLYVASLATDGWNRIANYDSNPRPVGFVLAPKP